MLRCFAPALFVFFWSTGFIVARGIGAAVIATFALCGFGTLRWDGSTVLFALALAGVVLARRTV